MRAHVRACVHVCVRLHAMLLRSAWQAKHNQHLDAKAAKESTDNARVREKARDAYDAILQQRQKLKDGNKKANR